MSDWLTQVITWNTELTEQLSQDEPDWQLCIGIVSKRDDLLANIADLNEASSEFKKALEQSLALNDTIEAKMKDERASVERSLLTINQGKKARASYE